MVDYGDMKIEVFGITWEVEYEVEFGGHVVINSAVYGGEDFFALLDEKKLLKIQDAVAVELAERQADRRDCKAEYDADLRRETAAWIGTTQMQEVM